MSAKKEGQPIDIFRNYSQLKAAWPTIARHLHRAYFDGNTCIKSFHGIAESSACLWDLPPHYINAKVVFQKTGRRLQQMSIAL